LYRWFEAGMILLRYFQHERLPSVDPDRDIAEELEGLRHVLKPAQEHVLAEMAGRLDGQFSRAEYEDVAHVSRSQAAYDLADLVKLGLVERLGSGRATRYRVARGQPGRRRKWTPERIRTELEAFVDDLECWPGATEFKDAGHGDLYIAASRYGGIDYWADELGFVEEEEPAPDPSENASAAEETRHRRDIGLVGAGLAALAAAALLVFALVFAAGDRPGPEQALAGSQVRAVSDAVGRPANVGGGARKAREIALRLRAARGDSWLIVRRDSAGGRLLWEGLLERGATLAFRGQVWLRLGAPSSLVARVNGDRTALPTRTSTARVTARGIRILQVARPPVLTAADSGPALVSQAAPVTQTSSPAPSSSEPTPDPPPGPGSGPSPDPPPGD
jgi:hypothetical protein